METKEQKRAPAKKTAQRSPQKRKTAVGNKNKAPVATGSKRASAPRKSAAAVKKPVRKSPPRRRVSTKKPSADVVYVQPTPFNRTRFVLCLLIAVAVVLAVIFGMTIFFKVDADKITVSGIEKYTAYQIREASGIHDGENLFSISEPRISSNITDTLPYVNKVRVGIKLPDTVKIEIEELAVVYSAEATDGSWWLIRSDGSVVEKTNDADAQLHTMLMGVKLEEPAEGQKAKAFQPVAESAEGEEVPITVLASEQLSAALSVARYLEDVGVIGDAKSIDTTDMSKIEVWYGEQYLVDLGDGMELGRKIKAMKAAIDQMGDYQSGTLDVSFTTWPDEVGYTPFS